MSGFLMSYSSSILLVAGVGILIMMVSLVIGYIYYDQVILGRVYDYLRSYEFGRPDVYDLVSSRQDSLREFHEEFLGAKYPRRPTKTYYSALAKLLTLGAQLNGHVYICRGYTASAQVTHRLQLWDEDASSCQTSSREILWLEFSYNRRFFALWLTEDGCSRTESAKIFRRLLKVKTMARCCFKETNASICHFLH